VKCLKVLPDITDGFKCIDPETTNQVTFNLSNDDYWNTANKAKIKPGEYTFTYKECMNDVTTKCV
jgi:hypothetical protein